MKLHSGWIAAGLLLFVVLACNLSKNGNNSNNSNRNTNQNTSKAPTPNRPANAEVYVNRIYMARDNNGKPGAETNSFDPSDRTVYCVIDLNKAKKGIDVRYVWKAVDVEGRKDEEIKTIEYTTNSFEKQVQGHLQYSTDWPTGTYRVEVYINGNLDKTIDYTID
jgi:hypothetical protein